MTPGSARELPEEPVGRGPDLRALLRLTGDAAAGTLVVVSGEAGIGKTTFVNHLIGVRRKAGDKVLRGSADETDTARFALWRRVLRDLAVAPPHDDHTVSAADQTDELAAVVGEALIAGGYRLLVLEDLQWADDASVSLLRLVGERLVGCAVAMVATVRTGAPTSPVLKRALAQAEPINLYGVAAADIVSIAARRTGETLSMGEAEALHRMTDGNPLLVGEVLAAGDGRLSLAVHELLAKAVADLGESDAEVLSVLALAGRGTPGGVIARALETGEDRIDAALEHAMRTDVVRPAPDGVWFRHDLLATAAASRLATAERREVHRSLAECWASAAGGGDHGLRRARHLLGAVPAVPGEEAAEGVLAIATALRSQRRAGDAADLLERALDVVGEVSPTVCAQLWMALGEARWDLAERSVALGCFERAGQVSGDVDIVTKAMIEVARQRNHNPFLPDPDARERLAALDAGLGDHDSALRAALLGRRAVLALQPPARLDEARRMADEAVAVARRIDDPHALLVALCDRAFVLGDVDDLRRRGRLAEEVLDLARAAGRPDLAMVGHQWRCDTRLLDGDLHSAREALSEFEALAAVAPSPMWAHAVLVRKAGLHLAEGRRAEALAAIEAASQLAPGRVDPYEQVGVELSVRAPAMLLHGRLDPRFDELRALFQPMFEGIPSLFMQVRLATADLLAGERDAARRRSARWISRPEAAFEAPDALATLGVMAVLADELGFPDAAPAIISALAPFGGLLCADIWLPTDALLGQLHLLAGDGRAAVTSAQGALVQARSMGSPVAEARCLQLLGEAQAAAGEQRAAAAAAAAAEAIAEREGIVLVPPWSRRAATGSTTTRMADAPFRAPRQARITRDGDIWRVTSGSETGSVAHITGLTQLARLLQVPGVEISAAELAGPPGAPMADLGPTLDARAKGQYRRRINEIRCDIDEAERWADPERAEAARRELDVVMGELRRAVGLGGRDRPQGAGAERARINTARNLRRAIATISRVAPQLGAHLTVSVRTGHHCCYAPEPAAMVAWDVGTASGD